MSLDPAEAAAELRALDPRLAHTPGYHLLASATDARGVARAVAVLLQQARIAGFREGNVR
jgi:hypothetical protein